MTKQLHKRRANTFLPPARGKARMGVVEFNSSFRTTPTLALPLQGGGNYFLRLSRREQLGECQ